MLPSPQNQTAIISSDSDLLVYKGCLDVMRIMEIKWGTPSIGSIISTTKLCTKRDILQKLHLKHQDDSTFDMAEKRLMILASASGNDYAKIFMVFLSPSYESKCLI